MNFWTVRNLLSNSEGEQFESEEDALSDALDRAPFDAPVAYGVWYSESGEGAALAYIAHDGQLWEPA